MSMPEKKAGQTQWKNNFEIHTYELTDNLIYEKLIDAKLIDVQKRHRDTKFINQQKLLKILLKLRLYWSRANERNCLQFQDEKVKHWNKKTLPMHDSSVLSTITKNAWILLPIHR